MPDQQSALRKVISARGIITFETDLWHEKLGKHRTIRGGDPHFVLRIASVQLEAWERQWQHQEAVRARNHQVTLLQQSREQQRWHQQRQKEVAIERTNDALQLIETIKNTLRHTLTFDDAIDWEQLKDYASFPAPEPAKSLFPPTPTFRTLPQEPLRTDAKYQPVLGALDKLMASRRVKKQADAAQLFEHDYAQWLHDKDAIFTENRATDQHYEAVIQAMTQTYEQAVVAWQSERESFIQQQIAQNAAIDSQKEQYLKGVPDAITAYCDLVLSRSEYADFFPKEYELDYNPESKVLIVDYALPAPDDLPTLIEVKYIAARDEYTEKHLTSAQVTSLYDDLLHQVTLRTIHELFEADTCTALAVVVFNGNVRAIDRSTGNTVDACVLSLQANREEFLAINLAHIEPKACFKKLKGVGSSKLHGITPVAPIMHIRRDDGRFISSYDVADRLNDGYNLAAMDWEDFEHLIREVFGKEFSSNGGEVKVTQASRDGGVDAIAFDPDPIRGGKIVIQAKRYTNTVGVAAVRDLFGTVMKEGATKGILVTTSDYGPDAYEFANGKPLTLLSGANLLHLLAKHGHKARIDLREAKQQALARPAKATM